MTAAGYLAPAAARAELKEKGSRFLALIEPVASEEAGRERLARSDPRSKRLVHPPEVELRAESYGESVTMTLEVVRHREADLRRALAELRVSLLDRDPSG